MFELPFFILIKYSFYFFVFIASHKLLKVEGQSSFDFSFKWAGMKFLFGLFFGLVIAGVSSWSESSNFGEVLSYILPFVIVRGVEWFTLFKLLANYTRLKSAKSLIFCVGIGVLASMLSDLVWYLGDFNVPKFFC